MCLDNKEELRQSMQSEEISDEKLLRSSEKIMARNDYVYKELAK